MTAMFQSLDQDMGNLFSILDSYENDLKSVPEILSLKNKKIEFAIKEQTGWQYCYDCKKNELNTLLKYLEMRLEKLKGGIWKNLTEKSDLDLSQKDKENYVNRHESYVAMMELYLHVYELVKKFESVSKSFETRGYALKNLVDVYVHSLQDVDI